MTQTVGEMRRLFEPFEGDRDNLPSCVPTFSYFPIPYSAGRTASVIRVVVVALAHSSRLSIGRSVMVTVLLVIAALCLTTPTRGAATSRTDQPFDLALWESYFRDGRKYYACRLPRCRPWTLVSFAVERIEGDEVQALAREQETQRRIAATVAGRELLSFDVLSTQNAPGLRVTWRNARAAGEAPHFGALRIVIVSGTRVLVLATSHDEATAQRSELALSRWLGLAP